MSWLSKKHTNLCPETETFIFSIAVYREITIKV